MIKVALIIPFSQINSLLSQMPAVGSKSQAGVHVHTTVHAHTVVFFNSPVSSNFLSVMHTRTRFYRTVTCTSLGLDTFVLMFLSRSPLFVAWPPPYVGSVALEVRTNFFFLYTLPTLLLHSVPQYTLPPLDCLRSFSPPH